MAANGSTKRKMLYLGWRIQDKKKTRFVANGFLHKELIDYNEILSPAVKQNSIRVVLSMVTQFDIHLEHMDVIIALLHGDLEETIYMKQPHSFEEGLVIRFVC